MTGHDMAEECHQDYDAYDIYVAKRFRILTGPNGGESIQEQLELLKMELERRKRIYEENLNRQCAEIKELF